MSEDFFLTHLEEMCEEGRRKGVMLPSSEIYVHVSKHFCKDSPLVTENGEHFLSMADIIDKSVVHYIFENYRQCKDVWFIDSCQKGTLHYAAEHSLEGIFDCVKGEPDKARMKALAKYMHPESKETPTSILIKKDKVKTLRHCFCDHLSLSPFDSDFQDIYSNWIHDAVSSNAQQTSLYLFRNFRNQMESSLSRSLLHNTPTEHITPMDLALLSEENNDSPFFIDVLFSCLKGGFKLKAIPLSVVLCHLGKLDTKYSTNPYEITKKCIKDTLTALGL